MPDFFVNQTILRLRLNTRFNLTGATNPRILYIKPDGVTEGFFPATIQDGTFLVYNISNGDIDVSGKWTFQAYIETVEGTGYGVKTTKYFDTPITP